MPRNNDDLISPAALGMFLGVSDQWIRDLTKEGVIHGVSVGSAGRIKYDPTSAIPEYIAYIKSLSGEEGLKGRKQTAEARLKEAQAEAAELELAELRGSVHASRDVEFFVSDLCAHMRSAVLSLPSRLAIKINGGETRAEIADIIKRECYDILTEMSEYKYDPAKYREAAMRRRGRDIIDPEDDEEE